MPLVRPRPQAVHKRIDTGYIGPASTPASISLACRGVASGGGSAEGLRAGRRRGRRRAGHHRRVEPVAEDLGLGQHQLADRRRASPQWQQTLGGSARRASPIAGDAVIVEYRTRSRRTGWAPACKLWTVRRRLGRGGRRRRRRGGGHRQAAHQGLPGARPAHRRGAPGGHRGHRRLDVRRTRSSTCAAPRPASASCTAWDPRGSRPLWTVSTGGIGFVLDAANPDLPDTRPLDLARRSTTRWPGRAACRR